MTSVPSGGPGTINGVLYQMLWTLLKTMNIHASGCITDEVTGQITQAILRIEPSGGGGDLQEISGASRVVQQLKAKSSGGTWSLTEVTRSVLPDLYLAVDLHTVPDTAYEFVTEGRMGAWKKVYAFFNSLGQRLCPDDVLAALDDVDALDLGIRRKSAREDQPFWPAEKYTERRLFERIVEEVRKRQSVKEELIKTTHRKLWHLLGHFRFVGSQTTAAIQKKVDRQLLQLVDRDFDDGEKRDALLTALAKIATRGSADIEDCRRFLADHGLSSIAFSEWPLLRERSRSRLDEELKRLGYHAGEDVRLARAREAAIAWEATKPMLVVSGNSGQGKSWFLYALAQQFALGQELIILVEASGSARDDLTDAARIFWHDIKNNDREIPLDRIAERLRKGDANHARQWLCLLIDGVRNPEEAKILAKQPWEKWGVRLLVSCEPEIASMFETESQGRCADTISVGDFTAEELHKYLMQSVGMEWPDIPGDVRNTLRRPLLARLYRDVAGDGAWRPSNEYELYERYWDSLVRDERVNTPLNRAHLERLVLTILDSAPYPWTDTQLSRAGLDVQTINTLVHDGWLRRMPQRKFEIWHNRLLNWAVAASLVNSFRSGFINADKFCTHLIELYRETDRYAIRFLGYVLMDSCWLLANSAGEFSNLLDQVLRTIEDLPWDPMHLLFAELLPTIGRAIVPALFRRLEAAAICQDRGRINAMVDAIITFEADDVAEAAIELLQGDNLWAQRAVMRILSQRPSAKAL